MNNPKLDTARNIGFNAGAHDASHTDSTPCPYPAGSVDAAEWEAGYEAGAEYFYRAYPEA